MNEPAQTDAPSATETIAARLRESRVLPVVELPAAEHAVPLAEALLAGGLACVEITFRTPAARDGLRAVRAAFPDLLLGAGTVLTAEQLEDAVEAGADFVVSPGTNPRLLELSAERGIPALPGVCTPTEIELARSCGAGVMKFFPAEAMGGVAFLRALCAPYRDLSLVPTGGVDPSNLAAYLELPQVVACGGSWLARRDLLLAGDFERVRALAEEAAAIAARAVA